ncbi:MAG: hypothetical protein KDD47_20430, partial [Acidobacteria bacterium]|nr:hypothetical protein [Acidobacteriota bacterium]
YGAEGEALKVFHVRDGLALKMAQRAGLGVGLLSARGGPAVEHRARELGLDLTLLRTRDKLATFRTFLKEQGLAAGEVAFIGDDLPDLKVLEVCGLSLCPADAALPVQEAVHHVLDRPGGLGAVREAVEKILAARGELEAAIARFRQDR